VEIVDNRGPNRVTLGQTRLGDVVDYDGRVFMILESDSQETVLLALDDCEQIVEANTMTCTILNAKLVIE